MNRLLESIINIFRVFAFVFVSFVIYLTQVRERGTKEMRNLDATDMKILKALKENARRPLKDMSSEAFLTTPAVSARVEKLEKHRVIKGYHAEVDLEKLGYIVKAFIMITVEPEDHKKFVAFIGKEKNVLECHHITGPFSMLLKVVFETPALLDEFIGRLQIFGKTETQVVFSTLLENRNDII